MAVGRRIGNAILQAMEAGTAAMKMQEESRMNRLKEQMLRAEIEGWQSLAGMDLSPGVRTPLTAPLSLQAPAIPPLTAVPAPPPQLSSSSQTTQDVLGRDPAAFSPLRLPSPAATSVNAPPVYEGRQHVYQSQNAPVSLPAQDLSGRGINQTQREQLIRAAIASSGKIPGAQYASALYGDHTPVQADRDLLRAEGLEDVFRASLVNPSIHTREEIDPTTGFTVTVTGPDWSFNPNISQADVDAALDMARGGPTGQAPPPMSGGQPPPRTGGSTPLNEEPTDMPMPNPSMLGSERYSVTENISGNPIQQPEAPVSDQEWLMNTTAKIAEAQTALMRSQGMFGSRVNERGQTITRQPLSAERQREVETLSGIAGSLRDAGNLALQLNDHQGTAAILQGIWQKGQKYTGTNQDAIKLDQLREVLAATMARLVGETGRFTEGDVARGKALIPDLLMSQENTIWLINYATALLNERLVGFSRPLDPAILSGQGLPFLQGGGNFKPFETPTTSTPNNGNQNQSFQINIPNNQ